MIIKKIISWLCKEMLGKTINSILFVSQEKIISYFNYWKHAGIKYGHVIAMFSTCMVVHVSSFLGEVCKHILSADCSLRGGWKQVWKESSLIIIEVSIRHKVA